MSNYKIFNKSCYGLSDLKDKTIDAIATDPPYGIGYQNHDWDKTLPKKEIWENSWRVLKPGAYAVVFSAIRVMHRLMVDLEDSGFMIKDVLFWAYLNGMPKSRNIAVDIDKELGVASKVIGQYNYVQGYRKNGSEHYYAAANKPKYEAVSELGKQYKGAGFNLKPAYEPIILIQKPIEKGLNVAQNIIKYGTGALNIEATRLPYAEGETKVGHNPHPRGRAPANMIRTERFADGYDKFFLVSKVRQKKAKFNKHPTLKPVALMQHLVKLISFEAQTVLDPFMGSGSTGLACLKLKRQFSGYELEKLYFEIAHKRLSNIQFNFNFI